MAVFPNVDGQTTPPEYRLKLFVANGEPNSRKAQQTLQEICETYLNKNYTLDIIDVLQDYQAALDHRVLVAPTLIVTAPSPKVTIIGSLSNVGKVLTALGLSKKGTLA